MGKKKSCCPAGVSVRTQEDLRALVEAVRREGFRRPPRLTECPRRGEFPDGVLVLRVYVGGREYLIGPGDVLDLTPLRTVLNRFHGWDRPLVEMFLADHAAARPARAC